MEDKELLSSLASDLVELHNGTGIDLSHWDTAREFVTKFYEGDDYVGGVV
jgi:hypothetical protein